MIVTGRTCSFLCLASCLTSNTNGSKFRTTKIFAKKNEFSENKQQQSLFSLKVSKPVIARTAIAVFGLGFIDAGYSGDWSRIGVLTPQSEELLKVAAFLVVPLCIFLIFSLPKISDS